MSVEEARNNVLVLMEQKDKIESEIQELTSVLERVSIDKTENTVMVPDTL